MFSKYDMGILILHLLSDDQFRKSRFAICSYLWSISLSVGCDYPSEGCKLWRAVSISPMAFQMFKVRSMGKFLYFDVFAKRGILIDIDVYDLVSFF